MCIISERSLFTHRYRGDGENIYKQSRMRCLRYGYVNIRRMFFIHYKSVTMDAAICNHHKGNKMDKENATCSYKIVFNA
jgi:hypothetical protein